MERTAHIKIKMCGSETTEAKIRAIFNKNAFSPGETAYCRIILDNT